MARAVSLPITALLIAGFALASSTAASAAPVDATIDDLTYVADDADVGAGARVDNYTGLGSVVVVPSTAEIDGITYTVTEIADFAFGFRSMTSVTLPNTVTSIGYAAFVTNDMTSFTVPVSVTAIAEDAFVNNPLATVSMTGPAPTLGPNAFGTSGDSGPLVTYPWRFDASLASGGYTAPNWQGYRSQAVARVAFDTAGGGPAPAGEQVIVGSVITEPTSPTRDGFVFTGWSTLPAGGSLWTFATALDVETLTAAAATESPADLVLYAQWRADSVELADTGPASSSSIGWLAAALIGAGIFTLMTRRPSRAASAREL